MVLTLVQKTLETHDNKGDTTESYYYTGDDIQDDDFTAQSNNGISIINWHRL